MKNIISVSLSDEAITKLDETSKALGRSRSDFLEWVILHGFCWPSNVRAKIEEITRLQKGVADITPKGE